MGIAVIMTIRSKLFCYIMQRRVVIPHQFFGTTYLSRLQDVHVACMEKKRMNRGVLVGKPDVNKLFGRPGSRWRILKSILKKRDGKA